MLTLMNARPSLRWRRADNARPFSWLARFGAVALPALSGAFGATVAGAAECVVDAPISYAAVQGCISGSVPGDTVRVGPGLLDLKPDERITVKPGIVLAGAGIGQTVVQSTQGVPILVYVGTDAPHTSASTVVEGFTFVGHVSSGSERALRIANTDGISAANPGVIRNNEFRDFAEHAVNFAPFQQKYWTIEQNVFQNCWYGVQARQTVDVRVRRNTFRGYATAIRHEKAHSEVSSFEIVGNALEGGSRAPPAEVPDEYLGIELTDNTSPAGPANDWKISDNRVQGATFGISIVQGVGTATPDLTGVVIQGNCLRDNDVLGNVPPPPPGPADVRNATTAAVRAANNYGGTADRAPFACGAVTTTPWLKDIVYTGLTEVTPGDSVILEATVENTDGTGTGPASGVPVSFFMTPAAGGEASEVGVGATDGDGRAVVEVGAWGIGTYLIEAKAAGGCLTANAAVAVRQASNTAYDGVTYAVYSPTEAVPVSATVSPPAASTFGCGGPAPPNPGPVSFVASPMGGGAPILSIPANVNLAAAVPPSQARTTMPATMALPPGIYLLTVTYAGGRNCLPSSDTAVVVVAGPGDSASGGGWYKVDGFEPPRVNFGFTVQPVVNDAQGAGYKGHLLWVNNGKWRLKGVVDADPAAYGAFPCPAWANYAGVSDSPVCAAFRGTGMLEAWDATSMQWLPATTFGDQGAVTFTATAYDGGAASLCKKKACAIGDVADYFGIQIDPVPGTVLPESPPLLLKGGSIKAQ